MWNSLALLTVLVLVLTPVQVAGECELFRSQLTKESKYERGCDDRAMCESWVIGQLLSQDPGKWKDGKMNPSLSLMSQTTISQAERLSDAYAKTRDVRAAQWQRVSQKATEEEYVYQGVRWKVFAYCYVTNLACFRDCMTNGQGGMSCGRGACSGNAQCSYGMMAPDLPSCNMPASPAAPTPQAAPTPNPNPKYYVTLKNNCQSDDIWAAVRLYTYTGGAGWVNKGFFKLKPGATQYVGDTDHDIMYPWAREIVRSEGCSGCKERVWKGPECYTVRGDPTICGVRVELAGQPEAVTYSFNCPT